MMSLKVRSYLRELPAAIALALLTGVTTIILIMLLSYMLGGESRELQRQAVSNGAETIDSAIVARCELSHLEGILRLISSNTDNEELAKVLPTLPEINIEGLPCDEIISTPFHPGTDYTFPNPDGEE